MSGKAVVDIVLTSGGSSYVSPVVYIAGGYNESLTANVVSGGAQQHHDQLRRRGVRQRHLPGHHLRLDRHRGTVTTATVSGNAITALTMVQSGSGYTNPTLVVASSISATATATQSGGVVNGITITNNGAIADAGASIYAAPPAITVGPPPSGGAGPGGYLPPLVMPVVQGGAITHLLPACGGLLGCGSGYSIGGSATVSIVGTGAILVPVLGTGANAGKIMSVTVVQGTALNAGDGTYFEFVRGQFRGFDRHRRDGHDDGLLRRHHGRS